MDETPAEREQRLAEIKERTAMDRRSRRVEMEELEHQPESVQSLVNQQGWITSMADGIEVFASFREDALPATVKAREEATAALRRYAAEIGVEIATRWVKP
jgi:hypothetical protein